MLPINGENLKLVDSALRGIAGWLCQFIYRIIAGLFELFINISSAEVLAPDSNAIKDIYKRITMLLTIIMIFYVMFEFIKYIIQPDQMTDKEKGASKILTKMVVVVVLLAFVPDIFAYAFKIQKAIVENEVIAKIILQKKNISGSNFGRGFSASILHEFYYYDEEYWNDPDGKNKCLCEKNFGMYSCSVSCKAIVNANLNGLAQDGELPMMTAGLGDGGKHQNVTGEVILTPFITFDGIFAVAVGAFLIYILVLYCIDVGTRVFQLLFLQIIAPIPIIGYLSPKKDNIFEKWVKQCLATYLDLFLRLAIIYFALFICEILSTARKNEELFKNLNISSGTSKTLLYIALIMGLLLFAQRAPKLLEELFPKMKTAASGNFGLKAGERVAPMAARALGVGLGATKLAGNVYRRAAWAHARNKANGQKSVLTKEGRQQFKDRWQKRHEARRAQRDAERYGSNSEVDAQEKIRKWKEFRNDQTKDLREKINNETDKTKRAALETQLSKKEKELENTSEYREYQKALRNSRIHADSQNAKRDLEKAQTVYDRAKQATLSARATGNLEAINAAEAQEAQAKKAFENAKQRHDKLSAMQTAMGGSKEETKKYAEKLRQEANTAQEAYVKAQNERYQGAAGVLASAAAGTVKTMWTGGHATKLEEVRKKVHEGVEADKKSVKAVQQYYDAGGTGWVDRTVQQVQKSLGGPTTYEQTQMQIRSYEPDIKEYGAQADLAKSYGTAADRVEDRFKAKAKDSKSTAKTEEEAKAIKIKTGLSGDRGYAKIAVGETLGHVARRYEQEAINAHTTAENAIKDRDAYLANHGGDISTMSTVEQEEYQKKVEVANTAAQAEIDAKKAAENVEKNVGRYDTIKVMEELAKDPPPNMTKEQQKEALKKYYDGAGVENAWDLYQRMEIVRQNPKMAEAMRVNLQAAYPDKWQEYYQMFMTGNIIGSDNEEAWDAFDNINNSSKAVASEYERLKANLSEKQREIQTSKTTEAQKAANDFNGSGK